MKKTIYYLLFLALLLPQLVLPARAESALSYADAYKSIVKIELFSLSADGFLENVSSGSGIIIDESGLVLTNYHVVTEEEDYDASKRLVGYNICLTTNKDLEPECKYTASFVASDKDNDIALLKINNISGLSSKTVFPYLKLAAKSIDSNAALQVLGYPGIGGDTITMSQGVVSGKMNKYNLDWVKTDADISFGNSGGAGINKDGEVIGIATRGHADMLGSVGYLVDISSINTWINDNKNKSSQISSLESRVVDFAKKRLELEAGNVFEKSLPAVKITKQADWNFRYNMENRISVSNDDDDDSGSLSLEVFSYPYELSKADLDWVFKSKNSEYMAFIDIIKTEDIKIGGKVGTKFTISIMGEAGKIIYITHGNFVVELNYDYGLNDKDKQKVDTMINSIVLSDYKTSIKKIEKYSNNFHKINLNTKGTNWSGEEYESLESLAGFFNTKTKGAAINISVSKRGDDSAGLTNNELYDISIKGMESAKASLKSAGVDAIINSAKSYANLGNNINDSIMIEASLAKNGKSIMKSLTHALYLADRIISIELDFFGEDSGYEEAKTDFYNLMNTLSIDAYNKKQITEKVLNYLNVSEDIGAKIETSDNSLATGQDKILDNSSKGVEKKQALKSRLRIEICTLVSKARLC